MKPAIIPVDHIEQNGQPVQLLRDPTNPLAKALRCTLPWLQSLVHIIVHDHRDVWSPSAR